METALAEVLAIADEVGAATDMEREEYWPVFRRADGMRVTLMISVLARSVAVVVRVNADVAAVSIATERVASLRVLDAERRILEAVTESLGGFFVRCVVAVDAAAIVVTEYGPVDERASARP